MKRKVIDRRMENFDILRFRYLESDGSARSGRDRILDKYGTKALSRLLRSHYMESVEGVEIVRRDQIDDLLAFYMLLEVATVCGYIPEQLPAEFVDQTSRVLSEPRVRRFYKRFSPPLLVQLFSARLANRFAVPAVSTQEASRAFIRFLDISEILRTNEVDTFLWFLDDGEMGGEDFENVVEKIQTPKALAAALTKDTRERSPSENAVQGFRGFTAFARQFDALLQSVAAEPILQSTLWHYHGYWLQLLSGTVLGVMSMAIEQQRGWVTLDPVGSVDVGVLARQTHASMDETELVLQRLTSGIYRANLERFYFENEFRANTASEETQVVPKKHAELIRIDPKSEEGVSSEFGDALTAMLQEAMAEASAATNVHDIENMPAEWADKLEAAGYDDLDSLLNAEVDDLTAIDGVDAENAAQMIELAHKHEPIGEDEEEPSPSPEPKVERTRVFGIEKVEEA